MRTPDLEILLKRHGFPLYVYDRKAISGRIARLRDIFSGFDILYSMKCNSNREICRHMADCGAGIDAASKNEVLTAHALAFPGKKSCFQPPVKAMTICGKRWINA